MVGRRRAPVHDCIDIHESCELVHVIGSAPRCKHIVEYVTDVVPRPVVGIEECHDMLSRALDRVRMCPSAHISETDLILTGVCSRAFPGPGKPNSSH
jgi:hypothetical protein